MPSVPTAAAHHTAIASGVASATLYRPDLAIRKTALSDTNRDTIFVTGSDSSTTTNPSETIRYVIEYNNL